MNPAWINHHILISPNELFDKGGEGTVVAVEGSALALTLSVPATLPSGKECRNLVASIRHANRTVDEIMAGHAVLCAPTLVPVDKFDAARPCDASWWRGGGAAIGDIVRAQLKPFYSVTGRPSVDPERMMRMLIIGYCMGIRSERRLCEEVHLNLAYRWFCRLGLDGKVPDHSSFSKNRHGRFRGSGVFLAH